MGPLTRIHRNSMRMDRRGERGVQVALWVASRSVQNPQDCQGVAAGFQNPQVLVVA